MEKSKISAKIIADSINVGGDRITTFVLTYPRFIHGEILTHRAFSRSSASSRAVPFKKQLASVKTDPFIPIAWQRAHSGMQGKEYFTDHSEIASLENQWLIARDLACRQAKYMDSIGVTKQITNRILEPYMWHTAIVTSTDFENFFALRAEGMAEIHLQKLAYEMLEVYNGSIPKTLKEGEWHLPFSDNYDDTMLEIMCSTEQEKEILKRIIAIARVARISYMNHEGKDDYIADLKLYDLLESSKHFSPFEHAAQCSEPKVKFLNFTGWQQLRYLMGGGNQTDNRVSKL